MVANLRLVAGLISALAAIIGLVSLGAGRNSFSTSVHASYTTRQLRSAEDSSSSNSAGGSHAETNSPLNGTRTIWRQVTVSIPKRIQHDYDPRCDTTSSNFQMHNRDILEKEGISFHQVASKVGILKFTWFLLKLILAVASLSKLPLQPAAAWRIDDQSEKEAAAGNLQLTKEELRNVLCKGNWDSNNTYIIDLDKNWEEVCCEIQASPEHKDQASAIEHAKIGTLTLYAFERYGMRLVPKEFSGQTWGSGKSAWLALQCAVGRSTDCGLPAKATLASLVQNRYNPSDAMPHTISISQMLPQSEDFNLHKFESYMKMKLAAPAKIMGLNAPWSNQVQMMIFVAQALQGIIEIVSVGILGPPAFWQYYHTELFFLTFRLELCAPVFYLVIRALLIQFQCHSLFLEGAAEKELVGDSSIFKGKAPWPVKISSNIYVVVSLVVLVPLFAFMPAMYLYMLPLIALTGISEALKTRSFLPEALLLKIKSNLPAAVLQCLRALGVLVTLVPIMGWVPFASHFMKQWLSRDTYICTFSRLQLFETRFDINSVSGYLLVILGTVAILVLIAGALTVCMMTPSIMSPKLVYTIWLWNSQELLCWALEADKRSLEPYEDTTSALEQRMRDIERQALLGIQDP